MLTDDTEPHTDDYEEEECSHPFHDEKGPKEDVLETYLTAMEGGLGQAMNQLRDEKEERQQLLEEQRWYEAERCPRCGRPHYRKSKER